MRKFNSIQTTYNVLGDGRRIEGRRLDGHLRRRIQVVRRHVRHRLQVTVGRLKRVTVAPGMMKYPTSTQTWQRLDGRAAEIHSTNSRDTNTIAERRWRARVR